MTRKVDSADLDFLLRRWLVATLWGAGICLVLGIAMLFTAPVTVAVAMIAWNYGWFFGVTLYTILQLWALYAESNELTDLIQQYR